MKRFIFLITGLLLPFWLLAQTNISNAEYWYDGNYGTAVQQAVTPGASVAFTDLLDVSSLEPGLHTYTVRFKDTRGIWGSVLTQFFTYYPGSDIGIHQVTDAEYWFDGDYATAVEQPLTPDASADLNDLLDVSSLITGLHTVTFRFKDDRGIWSAPTVRFFKKEANAGLQQLVAMEYWFNDDYANKHDSSFVATSSLDITKMMDISALRDGFNFLSLRVQDEGGKWGPAASWFFSKENNESLPALYQITALEYWYDGDYSTVQNDPVSATSVLVLNTDLDVSALDDGLHMVSYRFRDEAGNWSSAFSTLFSKYPADIAADMHELVSVEYWIDGDISSSEKSAIPAGSNYVLNTQLDVSSINDGLHYITYRFQDEAGVWSSAYSELFSKYQDEIITANNKITAYRYWADNEIGSAVEVHLATPVKTFDLDGLIDVSNFPGGEHVASFQFQDAQGQWSSAVSQTYSKLVKPWVSISATDSTVCAGSSVIFTADYVDADVIEWQFGDGSISNEFSPVHTYSSAGNYLVSALVTHTDSMKSAYDTIVGGITVFPTYHTWLGGLDTIFYDSFENETTETAPSNWIMKYNGSGTANQIVVENPVKNGIKAFQMEGSSWASEFYRRFTNLPEKVTIESWVNCEKILGGLAGSIGLGNFDVGGWGTRTSRLEFNAGKFVATYTGGSSYVIMDYTPGVWYHVRMVHDLANHTYQIYINDVLVSGDDGSGSTDVFPMHPTIATQDAMLCAGNSGVTKVFFDDITIEQEGTLEVCESDLPFVLGSQNISTEGYYSETFASAYGCDSIVSVNLLINPSGSSTQYDTICESDLPYSFGTQTLTAGGTFVENIPTGAGCDSMVTLHLLVKDTFVVANAMTVCETELPVQFGNTSLTASGTYTEVFTAANGCDSTVTLLFTVNDTSLIAEEVTVCENELPYTFGTQTLTSAGIYTNVYNNTMGCDSTVILTLNVLDTSLVTEEIEICESLLPFTFGTQSLSAGGVYTEVFDKTNGCDSTVILTLTVKDTFEVSDAITVCESELPYNWEGDELVSSGTYTKVLTSSNGCDSTVNLLFTVNDTSLVMQELTLCKSDLPYIFGTQTIAGSGLYTEVFSGSNGCDSTVILTLIVNDTLRTNLDVAICEDNLPYTFGTRNLVTSGVYSDTLTNTSGCDSIVILTLNVNDTFLVSEAVVVCESDLPYNWEGDDLLTSGSYIKVFTSEGGCDSTVTLEFTVKDTSLIAQEVTLCENDLPYTLGAQTLTAGGTYTEVFSAANGCDSTIVLTLNVLDTSLVNEELVLCESDLPYTFGTQTLTGSGTFTEVFAGNNGCDSTVILALTVNDTFRIADTLSICENDLPYAFGTQTLTGDGIYTELFTSSSGCDSTVVLVFAVSDTFSSTFADTVCENDLPYVLGTQSIYASGTYVETFVAENGCDSVVTLTLVVHQSYNTNLNVTVQKSDLPYIFLSQNLYKTGVYTNTLNTVFGCDSVITLRLLVEDNIPPVAQCHSIEVELSEDGSYILSAADLAAIAQGSNDDITTFNDLEIEVSPSVFTCADVGESNVTVRVSDAAGNEATCQTTVKVMDLVTAPKIDVVADQMMDEDSTLSVILTGISGGTQCNEWVVNLSAQFTDSSLISAVYINYVAFDSTAELLIVPVSEQYGSDSITVSIQDSLGNTTSIRFLVTVNAVNDSPVILQTIEDQSMNTGDTSTILISKLPGVFFGDVDDSSLVFSFSFDDAALPEWVNIQEEEEQFILMFTPTAIDTGCVVLKIIVTDLEGLEATSTFNLCVSHLVGTDIFEMANLKVYPNPTTGKVYVDFINGNTEEVHISVLNAIGEVVLQKTFKGEPRLEFDLSNRVSGFYYLRIRQESSERIFKLILTQK